MTPTPPHNSRGYFYAGKDLLKTNCVIANRNKSETMAGERPTLRISVVRFKRRVITSVTITVYEIRTSNETHTVVNSLASTPNFCPSTKSWRERESSEGK